MNGRLGLRCPWCSARHAAGVTICPLTGHSLVKLAEPHLIASVASPAAEPVAVESPAQTREVLGSRYAVLRVIGSGSSSTVYECLQLDNHRTVAVKVLCRELAESKRWLGRFNREARLTAMISHTNICRIYDFGTLSDGRPYYVMELLNGEPLSSLIIRRGPMSARDAVEVAIQLVAGLRVAHEADVVHRDIKPENVLLTDRHDGRKIVKIVDFGLCKDLAESIRMDKDTTQFTQVGTFVGSPFYVAPEQFDGSEIDARADLWAVGVVLFEMLTGQRPFMAPNLPQLLVQIATKTHPGLSRIRPGLPADLIAVVDKALRKNRRERYQNARQLLGDLVKIHTLLGVARPA